MTLGAAPSAALAAAARMAVAAACVALAGGSVRAADASPAAASPRHATRSEAPAPTAAPGSPDSAYEDRVIETMGFDPLATIADEADPFDPEGLPRQLRVEGRGIHERSTLVGSRKLAGLSIFGLIEKPNYGAISIDADLRSETGARGAFGYAGYGGDTAAPRQRGTIAIRQRGMPLGDGMSLDNDLGFFAAPAPPLARVLSRINVPAPRLQGAASQWFDERRRLTALAALGQPMQFDGLGASQVQRLPGHVVQLGGQWDAEADRRPAAPKAVEPPRGAASEASVGAPEAAALQGGDSRAGLGFEARRRQSPLSTAVMFGQGRGLTSTGLYGATLTGAGAARFDAQSAWLGTGGERGRDLQWQAQMLSTRLDAGAAQGARTSRGGWADVQWRQGELAQGAGLYALDRSLSWLGLPLASDVTGGYWRGSWQTRRWTADGGVDLLRSPSTGKSGWFAVAGMRQRLTSKLDWGTFGSMRNFAGRAHSLAGDLQWRNGMGTTDLRAEATGDGDGGRARRLTLQHDWDVEPGFAFATSVSGGRARIGSESALPSWAAAVSLEVPLKTTATVRGTFNAERNGDQNRRGFNAALVWPLSATWTLEAGALLNRGQTRVAAPVDPLAPPSPAAAATAAEARSAYLALRYELRGGTPTAPFGGRPQDGGGTIEGRVFFDANRNGRLDAGEQGAPGVTVQLDGRWSVKTDSQGRYEFAWVAKGPREVVVLDETLPLPWAAPADAPRGVEVVMRQTVRRDIAVVSP